MARIGIRLLASTAAAVTLALASPLLAEDDDVVREINEVCGPDVSAGRFDMAAIGGKIAGTWSAQAPGLGFTTGVQAFKVRIVVEYGRVYVESDGAKVALTPVHGARKALRYDPIRQKELPREAHAVDVTLEEVGLVADCDLSIAPQFTWTHGMGAQSSGGIYTFLSPHMAIGTMWNSARGAREVFMTR